MEFATEATQMRTPSIVLILFDDNGVPVEVQTVSSKSWILRVGTLLAEGWRVVPALK